MPTNKGYPLLYAERQGFTWVHPLRSAGVIKHLGWLRSISTSLNAFAERQGFEPWNPERG